eukprot:scaffold71463_cov62-Phaeocystis_antarctica.AAC.4
MDTRFGLRWPRRPPPRRWNACEPGACSQCVGTESRALESALSQHRKATCSRGQGCCRISQ